MGDFMSDIESDADENNDEKNVQMSNPPDDGGARAAGGGEADVDESDVDGECDWGDWQDDDVTEDPDALEMLGIVVTPSTDPPPAAMEILPKATTPDTQMAKSLANVSLDDDHSQLPWPPPKLETPMAPPAANPSLVTTTASANANTTATTVATGNVVIIPSASASSSSFTPSTSSNLQHSSAFAPPSQQTYASVAARGSARRSARRSTSVSFLGSMSIRRTSLPAGAASSSSSAAASAPPTAAASSRGLLRQSSLPAPSRITLRNPQPKFKRERFTPAGDQSATPPTQPQGNASDLQSADTSNDNPFLDEELDFFYDVPPGFWDPHGALSGAHPNGQAPPADGSDDISHEMSQYEMMLARQMQLLHDGVSVGDDDMWDPLMLGPLASSSPRRMSAASSSAPPSQNSNSSGGADEFPILPPNASAASSSSASAAFVRLHSDSTSRQTRAAARRLRRSSLRDRARSSPDEGELKLMPSPPPPSSAASSSSSTVTGTHVPSNATATAITKAQRRKLMRRRLAVRDDGLVDAGGGDGTGPRKMAKTDAGHGHGHGAKVVDRLQSQSDGRTPSNEAAEPSDSDSKKDVDVDMDVGGCLGGPTVRLPDHELAMVLSALQGDSDDELFGATISLPNGASNVSSSSSASSSAPPASAAASSSSSSIRTRAAQKESFSMDYRRALLASASSRSSTVGGGAVGGGDVGAGAGAVGAGANGGRGAPQSGSGAAAQIASGGSSSSSSSSSRRYFGAKAHAMRHKERMRQHHATRLQGLRQQRETDVTRERDAALGGAPHNHRARESRQRVAPTSSNGVANDRRKSLRKPSIENTEERDDTPPPVKPAPPASSNESEDVPMASAFVSDVAATHNDNSGDHRMDSGADEAVSQGCDDTSKDVDMISNSDVVEEKVRTESTGQVPDDDNASSDVNMSPDTGSSAPKDSNLADGSDPLAAATAATGESPSGGTDRAAPTPTEDSSSDDENSSSASSSGSSSDGRPFETEFLRMIRQSEDRLANVGRKFAQSTPSMFPRVIHISKIYKQQSAWYAGVCDNVLRNNILAHLAFEELWRVSRVSRQFRAEVVGLMEKTEHALSHKAARELPAEAAGLLAFHCKNVKTVSPGFFRMKQGLPMDLLIYILRDKCPKLHTLDDIDTTLLSCTLDFLRVPIPKIRRTVAKANDPHLPAVLAYFPNLTELVLRGGSLSLPEATPHIAGCANIHDLTISSTVPGSAFLTNLCRNAHHIRTLRINVPTSSLETYLPSFTPGIAHKLRRVVVLSHKDRLVAGNVSEGGDGDGDANEGGGGGGGGSQYVNNAIAAAAALGFHLTFTSSALALPAGFTSKALFTSELKYEPMSPEERRMNMESDDSDAEE